MQMFARCMTQWRAGPAGIIGLDYGVVLQLFSLYRVPSPDTVLEDMQIMEDRALERFRQAQDREAA